MDQEHLFVRDCLYDFLNSYEDSADNGEGGWLPSFGTLIGTQSEGADHSLESTSSSVIVAGNSNVCGIWQVLLSV